MQSAINLDDLTDAQAHRVLFKRLIQLMAKHEAYAPLTHHGTRFVATLHDDILEGRLLAYDESTWRGLFARAHRNGSPVRRDPDHRVGLLGFLVCLRDALRRHGPAVVPMPLALRVLLRCEYEPGCVDLVGPPWRLHVTGYGAAALGVYGLGFPGIDASVAVSDDPATLFAHHLAGHHSVGPDASITAG